MKTIFLVTTPTSGTMSMCRVIQKILGAEYKFLMYYDKVELGLPREEVEKLVPPLEDHFLFHNAPHAFNRNMELDNYRFILNFRDPRDRLCNQYAWQFVHPAPHETPEQTETRRARVREIGIDQWALNASRGAIEQSVYDGVLWLGENLKDVQISTYAQLCCDFDYLINGVSAFTGKELTASKLEQLKEERPEAIENHDRWIGARWAGTDIMPGRYKSELKPETIAQLNKNLEPILRRMARLDPHFRDLYLEGLDEV